MSESERPPASENPYAPSQVGETRAIGVAPSEDQPRTYQVRMSWPTRYRFLRSVGPLRLAAIAGAVVGGCLMVGLLQATVELTRMRRFDQWWDVAVVGRSLFAVATGCLGLYVCWQNWKLADALAAVAGGKTTSLEEWSVLQLRLARVGVAVIALSVVKLAYEWIMGLILFQSLKLPDL